MIDEKDAHFEAWRAKGVQRAVELIEARGGRAIVLHGRRVPDVIADFGQDCVGFICVAMPATRQAIWDTMGAQKSMREKRWTMFGPRGLSALGGFLDDLKARG